MPFLFQKADRVLTQSFFNPDFVREPLVMDPHRAAGRGNIHAVIHHVHDELECRGDDAAASGTSGEQKRLSILHHNGGRHGTEHPFLRLNCIELAADEAIRVRYAELG